MERVENIKLFDRNQSVLADQLKNSPKRAAVEPAILAEFERVKDKYKTKKGHSRRTWFEGTLRDVATDVGLFSEYELLQRQLSGAVHSSPLTLADGAAYCDFLLLDLAWQFSFRVLGKFAEFKEVELDELELQFVDRTSGNVFDQLQP